METQQQPAKEPKRIPQLHEIVVNGRPREFVGPIITYEEVVKLALPDGPFDIVYTVAYSSPHGQDGTLAPGQKTPVHDGIEFRVRKTNRS